MKARFNRHWASASRANLALALTMFRTGSASVAGATPERKKPGTAGVYGFFSGEIPNLRAITAWLRRQKANVSQASRAVFGQ